MDVFLYLVVWLISYRYVSSVGLQPRLGRGAPSWNGLCLPGERWTEGCTKCLCTDNGKVRCDDKERRFCKDDPCIYPSVWYSAQRRCHCTVHKTKICVDTADQIHLDGKQCREAGSFFYDDCVKCTCNNDHLTSCKTSTCEDITNVCTPGEHVTDACRRCKCTNNMYQVCRSASHCSRSSVPKPKPGTCPSHYAYILPTLQRVWCLLLLKHNCMVDKDCPGPQKCCIKGCFYTCMDPEEFDSRSIKK